MFTVLQTTSLLLPSSSNAMRSCSKFALWNCETSRVSSLSTNKRNVIHSTISRPSRGVHLRTESSFDIESPIEGDYCMPGDILVSNDAHEDFTVLTVEVQDYPGLFRVVAWVLNGLDIIVENAEVDTTDEGMALQTFWLTNKKGKKLSARAAELLAERVSDFVVYCTPDQNAMQAEHFKNGNIEVDNAEDPKYTVLQVLYTREDRSALLNIAMVLSGIGVLIHKAIIQACAECEDSKAVPDDFINKNRLFKFWVTDRQGKKLNYDRISSMLYTLGLVQNNTQVSSRPPLTSHTDYAQGNLEESLLYDR